MDTVEVIESKGEIYGTVPVPEEDTGKEYNEKYTSIIITIYHNDTWSEMFQFDFDGIDNLDTAVARLVRETQLDQDKRDRTKPVE